MNQFPTYQEQIHLGHRNRPVSIEVTPLIMAGANYSEFQHRFIISNILRRVAYQAIHQYNNWPRRRIMERVIGFLKASTLNSEACTSDEITIGEIDRNLLEHLMERIHQSNNTVLIGELTFEFIFDVNSLREGNKIITILILTL